MSWIKNIMTLQHARDKCVSFLKDRSKLNSYLEWSDVKPFVRDNICFNILEDKKVKKIINISSYISFEKKLTEFDQYFASESRPYFISCSDFESKLKQSSCISKRMDKALNTLYHQWITLSNNEYYRNHQELIIKRMKNKLPKQAISRSIASDSVSED